MKSFQALCLLLFSLVVLCQCSGVDGNATHVPGPAAQVTRSQALSTAYAYTQVRWTPRAENVLHGRDANGVMVHTPDTQLSRYNFANGWWKIGEVQFGMPYQWGGFDTPASFSAKVARGRAAGDISTSAKRAGGDAVVSQAATGIDCSGFVSRCWRLSQPYSTAQLPQITDPISWSELQPGDIILGSGHVLLFAQWAVPGSQILAYEAGPFPRWKVSANRISTLKLVQQEYQPRRYHHIVD